MSTHADWVRQTGADVVTKTRGAMNANFGTAWNRPSRDPSSRTARKSAKPPAQKVAKALPPVLVTEAAIHARIVRLLGVRTAASIAERRRLVQQLRKIWAQQRSR